MHRLVKYGIIFIISLSLTITIGCGQTNDEGEEKSNMKNLFEDSDQQVSDEIIETVLDGINNEDTDSIKNIFSEKAVSESENFDDNVQSLFDFIDGEVVSYEESDPPSSFDSSDSDYKIKLIKSYYYMSTNSEKYFILIENYAINTKNIDNQGVKCLIIVKADDRQKVFDRSENILFNETGRIDRYGVFIPDIYK